MLVSAQQAACNCLVATKAEDCQTVYCRPQQQISRNIRRWRKVRAAVCRVVTTCLGSCNRSYAPASMPRKKLFVAGYSSLEDFFEDMAFSDTQQKQLRTLFDHVLLSAAEASPRGISCSNKAAFAQQQAAAAAIVCPSDIQVQITKRLRSANRTLFIACWHPEATENALMRWQAFEAGANMVTHCSHALLTAIQQVANQQLELLPEHQLSTSQDDCAAEHGQEAGSAQNPNTSINRVQGASRVRVPVQDQPQQQVVSCSCDWCGLLGLSAAEYWQHQQLYHINHPNKSGTCQICGRLCENLAMHLHDHHDPADKPLERRTGVFALAIVRRPTDGKFLMTQEFAGSGYWVPGGGVNAGETLADGAVRECWEEAGVHVELKGILCVQSHPKRHWRRIIFWSEPAAPSPPSAAAASKATAEPGTKPQAGLDGHLEQIAALSLLRHGATPADSYDCAAVSDSPGFNSNCCSPKTVPDWESAGACWVHLHDLQQLPLRHPSEPRTWFPVLDAGVDKLPRGLQLPDEWVAVFEGYPCS